MVAFSKRVVHMVHALLLHASNFRQVDMIVFCLFSVIYYVRWELQLVTALLLSLRVTTPMLVPRAPS